jgi:hypothetical protein
MSTMTMGAQGQGDEYEQGREGVKVEKNTRGHNSSYRVNRKEGQTWADVLREVDEVERGLRERFGRE